MDVFLYTLPSWLLFILIVGGSVGLAWIGTVLLRRRTTAPKDDRHNPRLGQRVRLSVIVTADGVASSK